MSRCRIVAMPLAVLALATVVACSSDSGAAGGSGDTGNDGTTGFADRTGWDSSEIQFRYPDADAAETAALDLAETLWPEVGPDCSVSPAPFGCPCMLPADCQSGYCIDTQQGKQCTNVCVDECPTGWLCSQVVGMGPDTVFLCVDPFARLCRPCKDSDPCWGGQCVEYGLALGSFCGAPCKLDADCPAGFVCKSMDAGESQCVAQKGDCPCSQAAVNVAAETACAVSGPAGVCAGRRICLSVGELPPCDADEPLDETCDGTDNDCDGTLDEVPPACQQGRVCACQPDGPCACECPLGLTDCSGTCTDLDQDSLNCKECGFQCVGDNVKVASCIAGSCQAVQCHAGWADGDGQFFNGCECPVSAETCDGMDNDCNQQVDEGANLCGGTGECQGQCVSGQCQCPEGCAACDAVCKPMVFFQTSPENCGGCGKGCSLPGTLLHGCADGKCFPVQCAAGFENCDQLPGNGCEFTLMPEACDGQDNDCDEQVDELPLQVPCPVGMTCQQGQCACPAGKTDCGGFCVDVLTSKDHCGECNVPCAADQFPGVLSASCVQGLCTPGPCLPEWVDTAPLDPGCECHKTALIEKCDGLDNDCDGWVDEEPFSDCKDPMFCLSPVCICDPAQPNLLLCDGKCVDALADATHCGDCKTDCTQLGWPAVKTFGCDLGFCAVAACDTGFFDVNLDPEDGCECLKTSSVEQCDGADNDCDGEVDEDPVGEGVVCNTGMTAPCASGLMVCSKGKLSCVPDVAPGTYIEECDGLDNDCNGVVDDNIPQAGLPCSVPGALGPCVNGEVACVDGWIECVTTFKQFAELCDGVDSDCDSVVDDAPADAGFPCSSGLFGACDAGTKVCTDGSLVCVPDIEPGAQQEACNGEDDDCDDSVDEGNPEGNLPCPVPGKLGECGKGMSSCQNGKILCATPYQPQPEACDGLDNNCDGAVDETVPGAGQPCTVAGQLGECAKGTMLCGANGLECKQTVQPIAETCDGKDNNCNGVVDDGNPEGGAPCTVAGQSGLCASGQIQCFQGKLECKQVNFPQSETCDGKDNNCNGVVDDQVPEVGQSCYNSVLQGPCAQGTWACQASTLQCVQKVFPSTETCDNQDNNCNGMIDEPNALGCQTWFYDGDGDGYATNNAGSQCLCSPGNGYTTTNKGDCNDSNFNVNPGATEQCNNADENCNGLTDDNASCPGGFPCINGSCCQSHSTTGCQNGDVYWKSSCGAWEDLKEDCKNCSCSGNACQLNTQYDSTCVGAEVYWIDCKGNYAGVKQACGSCSCQGKACVCPSYIVDGCTGSNYKSGCASNCQGCVTENGFTAVNEAGCSGLTCFTRYPNNGYNGFVVMYARSSQTAFVEWAFPSSLSGNYKIIADIPSYAGLPAPSGCTSWNPVTNALYHIKQGNSDLATKTVNYGSVVGTPVILFQGNATGVTRVTLGNVGTPTNCGHFLIDRVRAEPY